MTKHIRLPRSTPESESNARITDAVRILSQHNRGQNALCELKRLFEGPAQGLDLVGQAALVTLVREFALGGRREFIKGLPSVVLPPKPLVAPTPKPSAYSELEKIFGEGFGAYQKGKAFSANPHATGTPAGLAWENGWLKADKEV